MIVFKKNREVFDFIYSKIDNSKKSIKLAVAWFTDPELSKLLLEKKNQRIEISIILFNDEINSLLKNIHAFGNSLRFSNSLAFDYVMHHKFCIIDDEIVITGSYNWTVKARRFNKENILCIDEKNIINQYCEEFESLLKNSTIQSEVEIKQSRTLINKIENIEILNLEKKYNEEIYKKIEETAKLRIGVNVDLAYKLVCKRTPVIASKILAHSKDGNLIQSGLRKVTEANRLDLSFEESIIKKEYCQLFDSRTKELAKKKLINLGFFSNDKYSYLWNNYENI
ncbi:phospholipase D-like domain-containing protein [Flavobacterium lindanitolerans]|uniref:phospholipase D-like domain-containing protein n=1 Tax=Flavobacterium lindanitolerans TaxID=428988 RepID=UPI0031D5BAD6